MRKFLFTLCCILCFTASFAQTTTTINSGTTVNSGGATYTVPAGSFVNNGTYNDIASGTFNVDGSVAFSGTGTTDVFNYNFTNNGSSILNATVTVHNVVTIDVGSSLDANGNLVLAPGASLVVNGIITNNAAGMVTNATATTGGCPSYSPTLSTNVSGSVIRYQWETSTNNVTYTAVAGATNATYTPTVNAPTYYHVVLTSTSSAFNQATSSVLLNFSGTNPAAISGATSVCVNSTTTLADADAGGKWTSSNTSIASVGSASGTVTGNSAGTTTISYTFLFGGGCYTTTTITVNPLPAAITGGTGICAAGATTSLTDATAGGAWTSSNTSVATIVSGTGVVTSGAAGTAVITYTLPTTCITTTTITVQALPAVSGGSNVAICAGNSTALAATGATSYSWSPTAGLSCTTCANPTATPTVTTTYTVTGSNPSLSTFNYSGSIVDYTVPSGVTSINIAASGAQGGNATTGGANGGLGADMSGTFSVTPGHVLRILVGQQPGNVGSNAGGGGGSFVWNVTTGNTLLIAAGGGGGASSNPGTSHGINAVTTNNGTAGNGGGGVGGGVAGNGGTNPANSFYGGAGAGWLTDGYNGTNGGCTLTSMGGLTPLNGGTGGARGGSIPGSNSAGGFGGGGGGQGLCGNTGAGGGGGGYSGGAAGAVPNATQAQSGGGGGSYNIGTSQVNTVTHGGNGVVTITGIGCTNTALVTVTVNPLPPAIGGSSIVCVGSTSVLSDAVSFGAWTSSNTSAVTIGNGSGIANGIAAGTTTITYTLPTTCFVTKAVTAVAVPTAITGASIVCQGISVQLTDATSGGTWSSSNTSIATVTNGGLVSNVATNGTVTITHTTGCGTDATKSLTVIPNPVAITGTFRVCEGLTTSLTDVAIGGTWTSSNTAIATVGSTGVVSAVATNGVVTITHATGCGTNATQTVTVIPNPVAITGPSIVCQGLTASLTDVAVGGTWTSSNTLVATVNNSGVVSAVATNGVITITHTTGCGTDVTKTMTVIPNPVAITGTAVVCLGGTSQLTDVAINGTWTSGNPVIATVTNTGAVTTFSPGNVIITHTTGCGTDATVTFTVNALPTAIGGSSTVCQGLTTTLTNGIGSGTWTSSATSIASVAPSTGVVSGVTAGSASITYTLPTGCFAVTTITVNPLVSAITGTAIVCEGLTTSLSDVDASGTWSSSNTTLATVNGSGLVSGVVAGNPTITYMLPTGCIATRVVTVNPTPAAISGTPTVCAGLTTTLSNTIGGGAWSSSNPGVGSVAGNVVTGVTAGTTTITYTLSAGCTAVQTVTVFPLPANISGTPVVCIGLTTTLTDATGGGVWSSSNVTQATIGSSTGLMTGIAVGNPAITYTLPTGCIATATGTVNPNPAAITGTMSMCAGGSSTLANVTGTGTWSSSNTTIATINSGSGLVNFNVAGTATITYALATGCIATAVVTVNPIPGNITGTLALCTNSTTSLASTLPFGAWTSGTTAVATVNSSTGLVTGVTQGTSAITYTLATGCLTTAVVTVNPIPAAITGTMNVCAGLTTNLASSGFGNWSSVTPSVATVGSGTGIVTGVAAGTTTISYSYVTGCSTFTTVTVNPLPLAITGNLTVCPTGTSTLSNASAGGVWSSGNTAIASVSGSTFTGLSAGTTTVTYTLPTGCINTAVFTVNPYPATITGTAVVCAGGTTNLANATAFGTWSSSTPAVATIGSATGIVSGVAQGTSTITYTLNTGCSVMTGVTVNPLPVAITGTTNVCIGLTTTLSNANTGGMWTSSNNTLVTVGSVSGVVTGIATGTPAVTYTLPTGCFTSTFVTVNPLPANISGTMNVCAGLTTTLSDATAGGNWSSSNTTVATIAGTVVTGVVAGTTTITYTLPSTGCINTAVVTVNPLPAAIGGTLTVCPGNTTGLTNTTPFGAWSSSNTGFVTIVSGTGVATGMAAGTATITYTLPTGCVSTAAVTVNPLPANITGTMNVCVGLTTTLTNASAGGTWMSSNTGVATIAGNVVTGLVAGTTTITYTLPTGCISTAAITVNPLPSGITGTTNVCIGNTTALANATPFGVWSSSIPATATIGSASGVVTGVAQGTTTITYTLGTGCIITQAVTVNPFPSAITGTTNVCVGNTTTLTNATGTGTWSSSNLSVATVSGNIVTGVAAGTTTITYTLNGTGCQSMTAVTVNPLPANITGTMNVCAGLTTALASATPSGTWTSSTTTVATINSGSGLVQGVAAGTTTITYTTPSGCITTAVVLVNPLPSNITGVTNVCTGLTTNLASATFFGAWSSSNTVIATVGPTSGIVTGMMAGTTTITYVLATGCITTTPVTVNPTPAAITGPASVCATLNITLSSASTGGAWTSGNTTAATVVSGTGVVTGINAGTSSITYTLPTGCMTTTAVTVNPLPANITGTPVVCEGLTTTLSNATPSGVWSSSNPTQAPIGATTGVVTGLSAGNPTITYALSTGCIATVLATVNPVPANITGTMVVCAGLTTTLSDVTPGGTWSSSNTAVATNAGNIITGIAAGTTTVTYTLPTGCIKTSIVTVNPLPASITGVNNICAGLSTSLADVTPFGAWSSSNTAVATIVSGTGVLTGLSTVLVASTTTITYTLSTGCISTMAFTVNPLPTAILGTAIVCEGLSTTLTDAATGGAWASSNTAVAIINGTSGFMTGVLAGTTTITYTLPTTCMITRTGTVNPLPAAITGATTHVCEGLAITLSDATPGGTWSSSNTAAATVISGTGVVTGVVAGTSTVTYRLTATGCQMTTIVTTDPLPATITGTAVVCAGLTTTLSDATPLGSWSSANTSIATVGSTTGVVTGVTAGTTTITYTLPTGCIMTRTYLVNPLPAAITGTMNVCAGLTTTLSDATGTGVWSSSNTAIAAVGTGTGVVTGVLAGTATITYTIPTGCIMTASVLVNPLPVAITGTMDVCAGLTTTLSDATPLGSWSSSNIAVATIGSTTGVATGIVAGTTTITYTLPTGCIMTASLLVNPLPAAITGSMVVCEGLTTTLSNATPLGTWSSSNTAVATVTGGTVTGVLAGTVTITYTIPTGCIMTTTVLVNPLPVAITGTLDVCAGLTTALSDASTGGTWSNDITPLVTVATIDMSTGILTGITAGTNTVTYTLPTGCLITGVVTVNPLPDNIAGTMNVCAGLTTTLSDATPSGMYSSGNTAIATVDMTTGVVTGVTAGTTTITYTLPTGCIRTAIMTVNPLPASITGTTNVCAGLTTMLSNATAGGMYSSGNTAVATVDATTGVVTGITAATATITYTIPTGCIMTAIVTVDPLPAAITGTMSVCNGLTTTLSNATTGGMYSSGNTAVATVDATTGVVTGMATGTVTITYTVPTGCIMTTVVTVDPLPVSITGTMNVCAGLTTSLSNANVGGMYSSGNTAIATIDATTGVATGVMAGTATVTYTLPTGCISTSVLTVNALPIVQVVSGGGSYCLNDAGVHILLGGSENNVTYELYNGATATGTTVVGNGSPLDFGFITAAGTYSVIANNGITGCTSAMLSTATVSINPLPTPKVVTGTGSYCFGDMGVHVGLATADAGIDYQLYQGATAIGLPVAGTGGSLDFGVFTAGTYTVMAKNTTTLCINAMTGNAVVTVNPLLTPAVSIYYGVPSDTICAGTPVTFTATPVNGGTAPGYVWSVNGVNTGTTSTHTYVPAPGDVVKVVLTSNAVCPVPDTAVAGVIMPIIPRSTPTVLITTGHNDTVCRGTMVTYTASTTFGGTMPSLIWVKNGVAVDSGLTYSYIPMDGDLIYNTLLSNYRCRDTSRVYSNNITMQVDSAIIPSVTVTANPGVSIAAGTELTLTADVVEGGTAPKYQWAVNGATVTGATSATFTQSTFANKDSVSVVVTRNDACRMSSFNGVIIHVGGVSIAQVKAGLATITVVPNPSKGEFTVKGALGITEDMEVSLELTNMLGQVVYTGTTTAKGGKLEAAIKLSNTVANGMYLLNVRSEAAGKVFHVVIEQ